MSKLKRNRNYLPLSNNTKDRTEASYVSPRGASKPRTHRLDAAVSHVANGVATVHLSYRPQRSRSRSRSASRRRGSQSRTRSSSRRRTKHKSDDVAVKVLGQSPEGRFVGLEVNGQRAVLDSSRSTLETGTEVIYIQRIEDDAEQGLGVEAVVEKKETHVTQRKGDGFLTRHAKNMTITLLIGIIALLLGRKDPSGTPCTVQLAHGLPLTNGAIQPVSDITFPTRSLIPGLSALQLSNICVVGSDSVAVPAPASKVVTVEKEVIRYATEYKTRQESVADQLVKIFSAGERRAAKITAERLVETARALDAAHGNIIDLTEKLDSLQVKSASDLRLIETERHKLKTEVDQLNLIVIPELKKTIDRATQENLILKKEISEAGSGYKKTSAALKKSEAALLQMDSEYRAATGDFETQIRTISRDVAEYREEQAAVLSLYDVASGLTRELAKAGVMLPNGLSDASDDLQDLVAKVRKVGGQSASNVDKIESILISSIAFHEEQIKKLGDANHRGAIPLARRYAQIRFHKEETKRIQEALQRTRIETRRNADSLSAAWTFNNMMKGKYVALRASSNAFTQLIAPTIVAERRPDGSYVVIDDVSNLEKLAPGWKPHLEELKAALTARLNGKPGKDVPREVPVTTKTRIFLDPGGGGGTLRERAFKMKLLRSTESGADGAPVQRFEYLLDEDQAPRIVVQTSVETKTVTAAGRVETVTATVTASKTWGGATETPSMTAAPSAATPWSLRDETYARIHPTPLPELVPISDLVEKLVVESMDGDVQVTRKTEPLSGMPQKMNDVVSVSGGVSESGGVRVIELVKQHSDVCSRMHPLQEFFSLVGTCKPGDEGGQDEALTFWQSMGIIGKAVSDIAEPLGDFASAMENAPRAPRRDQKYGVEGNRGSATARAVYAPVVKVNEVPPAPKNIAEWLQQKFL